MNAPPDALIRLHIKAFEFRVVGALPSPLLPRFNFLPAGSISVGIDGHCSSPNSINAEVRRVHLSPAPFYP